MPSRKCTGYVAGHTGAVDADLLKYSNTIPHADCLTSMARHLVGRLMLWLIKLWLRSPVEEQDGDGDWRMSGG